MKTPLQLLTRSLLAQAIFGKIQARLVEVRPAGSRSESSYPNHLVKTEGFADALRQENATPGSGGDNFAVAPAGASSSGINEHNRKLPIITTGLLIFGIAVAGAAVITAIVRVTSPDAPPIILNLELDVNSDGNAEVDLEMDTSYLNEDRTGLCEGCTMDVEAGECISGDCDGYDQDTTNDNIGGEVKGDPHMTGLRGQRINWSGVDGGWYSLIKDEDADLNVNVRVTAPLPDEFPDRQLISSLAVLSEGHSVVIEVENPYTIDTGGCPESVSPCLANGGLRITVDGQKVDELLQFSRHVPVADGIISVSASNLPAECRPFGGHKIWGRMYEEMLAGRRQLANRESFEDWILRYDDNMPASRWCAKYVTENDLANLQSTHAIFKIETSTVTVRLNAGINHQGDGEVDGTGRALPDLEFWQMDVGMHGLDVDNPALSGLLGETARPVYDENGQAVMEGFGAFRGTVEDYRVSNALGVDFPLLDEKEEGHE